ncbi:MAG TPA: MFS transporter [Acidimicrobiales bacterium]|nr:MFS transporter [Acidimicrobiales bacterium]
MAITGTAPVTPATAKRGFVRRTFSSLRARNFRLFFIGQTISNTGNWLTMVALTLLVLHRTGSGIAVGLLSACQFGPILLLSAWAGVIVDRTNKRTLLYVTQGLEMAQSFVLAALAFSHHAPLWAFYVTAAAGGCMLAFDNPVRRTFVNEMVTIEDVPNAVTLYSAMVNMSRIVGPAIAGVLIVTVGYGWSFTADAISYLTVLVALTMMRPSELRSVAVTPRGRGQVRAGLRYIASVPELWITFVMLLIVGTISYNFTVVFPLFVEKGLHGSDAYYTAVYSAFSAGALVGALAVARRTTVSVRTVAMGSASLGVAMLFLSAVPNLALAVAVATLVGATSVAYLTSTTALAQIRTEQHMIGRVLAIQTVLLVGTTPIGGPILGAITDAVGGRAPVIIGGVAALAAAAFGLVAASRRP